MLKRTSLELWRSYQANFAREHLPYTTIIFFGEFCRRCVKTWKGWINLSSFNACPSLPSVATDDRKQFQWLNKDLNNKTGPLFLIFKWCEKNFSFQKKRQWRGIASLSSNSSLYKTQSMSNATIWLVHWISHIAWKFLYHAGFPGSSFSPWPCLVWI